PRVRHEEAVPPKPRETRGLAADVLPRGRLLVADERIERDEPGRLRLARRTFRRDGLGHEAAILAPPNYERASSRSCQRSIASAPPSETPSMPMLFGVPRTGSSFFTRGSITFIT